MDRACTADTTLRSIAPSETAALLGVLDLDRATFDAWLRWSAGVDSVEAAAAFIARASSQEAEGRDSRWGPWLGGWLGGCPGYCCSPSGS